jgi:eukaryotic-like serine/threonine-protein kinase
MTDRGPDLSPVRAGDILAERYRVEQVIGAGGMGVVVAARHVQLDELVALKFLLPSALENPEVVARFAREARAAVKIKSEHVARVSDVGKLANGAPYMVMEYLEGCDLSGLLRSRGALPPDEAIDYLLQACEAIAEAHSLGIVHRDLKPANLYVVRRPDGAPAIKVLDFGISKMTNMLGTGSGPGASMTRTTAVLGSPLYMSPEQLTSTRDVDVRADIWSLGVILHELLTGRVPFEAETLPQLSIMIVQQAPPPLRTIRPELPQELESVIQRCLAKDRAQRFGNVAELALSLGPLAPARSRLSIERIVQVLRAAGVEAQPIDLAASGGAAAGTLVSFGNTQRGGAHAGVWIGLAAGLGVVAIAAAVLVLWMKKASPVPPVALVAASAAVALPPSPSASAPAVVVSAAIEAPAPSAIAAAAPDAAPKTPVRKMPAKTGGAKPAAHDEVGWDDRRK